MVDNFIADAGAGGETFASDDIGGVQYPISKFGFGALNSFTLASSGTGTDDAGTLRVTFATDIALPTGTNEIGNVKNSGTFATQSTLQAGTAEIGKLAAGVAEIGNVKNSGTFVVQSTLQAGTAAFGKLAANSGVDIGDVDVTTYPGPADAKFATLGQKNKAGSMPVTLATDEDALNTIVTNAGTFAVQSTLQAGTAAFGKLSANSGVDIGDVDVTSISAGSTLIGDVGIGVRTSGGIPIDSVYYDSDLDETAIAAKASPGQMYFIHAMNTTAAPLFLQIWNVAVGSVTVGTTVPDMQFIIPGNADSDGAGFAINFATPIEFDVEITVACTTDSEGSSAPGAGACQVNIGIN